MTDININYDYLEEGNIPSTFDVCVNNAEEERERYAEKYLTFLDLIIDKVYKVIKFALECEDRSPSINVMYLRNGNTDMKIAVPDAFDEHLCTIADEIHPGCTLLLIRKKDKMLESYLSDYI